MWRNAKKHAQRRLAEARRPAVLRRLAGLGKKIRAEKNNWRGTASTMVAFGVFEALLAVILSAIVYASTNAGAWAWSHVVVREPGAPKAVFIENFVVWFVPTLLVYALLYLDPFRRVFDKSKLNPAFPSKGLQAVEFCRSVRGVIICSAIEVWVNNAYAAAGGNWDTGIAWSWVSYRGIGEDFHVGIGRFTWMALAAYAWGDFHFYWTHRMLHSDLLYKYVHKVHHASFNPDPWSGLSMHWFESAIYFSAGAGIALVAPAWLARVTFKGLLVAPISGHSGHGSWDSEATHNHYLHHAKFVGNYGSTPLWDHIMGTTCADVQADKARSARARGQAKAVGADMGLNTREPPRAAAPAG